MHKQALEATRENFENFMHGATPVHQIFCSETEGALDELLNEIEDYCRHVSPIIVHVDATKADSLYSAVAASVSDVLIRATDTGHRYAASEAILKNYVPQTQSVEEDLKHVVDRIGQTVKKARRCWILIVRHLNSLTPQELSALLLALHRAQVEKYPVVCYAGGDMESVRRILEIKPYADRFLEFTEI